MRKILIVFIFLTFSLTSAQGESFNNNIQPNSNTAASGPEFTGLNGTLWDGATIMGIGRSYLGLRDGLWYAGNDDFGWVVGGRYIGNGNVFIYYIDPEYYLDLGIAAISICIVYKGLDGYQFQEFGIGLTSFIIPFIAYANCVLKEVDWYPPTFADVFEYSKTSNLEKPIEEYYKFEGLVDTVLQQAIPVE